MVSYLSVKCIDLIVETDSQITGGWRDQIGHDRSRVLIHVKYALHWPSTNFHRRQTLFKPTQKKSVL